MDEWAAAIGWAHEMIFASLHFLFFFFNFIFIFIFLNGLWDVPKKAQQIWLFMRPEEKNAEPPIRGMNDIFFCKLSIFFSIFSPMETTRPEEGYD